MNEATLRRRFEAFLEQTEVPALVVTAGGDQHRAGCLVTFHCQVSMGPQRYLVALSRHNHTTAVAATRQYVAVHVLPADRRDLAVVFGGRCSVEDDTFSHVPWRPWQDGTPVLDDAAGWFVGAIVSRQSLGDHDGVVLEPRDVATRSRGPLLTTAMLGHLPAGHPL